MWDQLQNSDIPPPQEDWAKWEAEFNQLMTSQREDDLDYDFGAAMQEAFQNGDHGDSQNKTSHQMFDDEGLPILTAYSFGEWKFHVGMCLPIAYYVTCAQSQATNTWIRRQQTDRSLLMLRLCSTRMGLSLRLLCC